MRSIYSRMTEHFIKCQSRYWKIDLFLSSRNLNIASITQVKHFKFISFRFQIIRDLRCFVALCCMLPKACTVWPINYRGLEPRYPHFRSSSSLLACVASCSFISLATLVANVATPFTSKCTSDV